jgi:hypothetical protein
MATLHKPRTEISSGREKGELRNLQEVSGMSAGNIGHFRAWRRKKSAGTPPPHPLSLFIILVMLICPRLLIFNFILYINTELTFFSDMTLQY